MDAAEAEISSLLAPRMVHSKTLDPIFLLMQLNAIFLFDPPCLLKAQICILSVHVKQRKAQ